jgi:antitoxin YefM
METTFKFNTSDLNEQFLTVLKTLFQDKEIEISVKEISDETTFLLNEPENKRDIIKAIQDLNEKKNLVKLNGIEYNKLVDDLKNA